MPAKVDPLQLSVSVPSRFAAAASSFSAALISWAGVAAHPVKMNAADRAILDRIDVRAGTESSRVIVIRSILEQILLRSSQSTAVRQLRPAHSPEGRGVG